MSKNPLQVLKEDDVQKETVHNPYGAKPSKRQIHSQQTRARLDREWLQDPQQFDPQRSAAERLRIQRCLMLLQRVLPEVKGLRVADLGCGYAPIATVMAENGAQVCASDGAANALKHLDKEKMELRLELLPHTKLQDRSYDLSLATDVLAELPERDYRLFISELARITDIGGLVMVSSPVRANSNAVPRMQGLVSSEFQLLQQISSQHRLFEACIAALSAPRLYYRCTDNPHRRKKELAKRRKGLPRVWFWLNSSRPLGYLWGVLSMVTEPLARCFEQSERACLLMERLSEMLWKEDATTHVVLLAKRNALFKI